MKQLAPKRGDKKRGGTAWKSRIVGHDKLNPIYLVAHPANYKAHPKEQAAQLKAVIDDVGFVRSVTVNRRTSTILDGHLRVALAIQQRQPWIDVELVDLTEAEERKVLATMDPLAGLAELDQKKLDELLISIGATLKIKPKKTRKPAANVMFRAGPYRFEVKRGAYAKWLEVIRKDAQDEEHITGEIKRRLGL